MGFLKGLANGFITERTRVKEREAQVEDRDFKYQMDELVRRRSKRDEQKAKEGEWKSAAKAAADAAGDPSFEPVAYQQFAAGRTLDGVMTDIRSGYWQKNKDFQQPETTVKIPTAVSMEHPEMEADGVVDPAMASPDGVPVLEGKVDAIDAREAKTKDTIRKVAPTLVAEDEAAAKEPAYTPVDAGGWNYKKNDETKVVDWRVAKTKLEKAKQANDTAGIRQATLELQTAEAYETFKATASAKVKGEDVQSYAYFDKNGVFQSMIPGVRETLEDGTQVIRNAATGEVASGVNTLYPMSEEGMKEFMRVSKEVGKESKDLKEGATSYVGALQTTNQMLTILDRNEGVTTTAATLANFARNAQDEVKGYWGLVQNQRLKVEQAMSSNAPREEKMAIIEREMAGFEQAVEQALSPKNIGLADDKAVYETLKVRAAFQFAKSLGMSGRDISDKDYQRIYQGIGADGRPDVVRRALFNEAASAFNALEAKRVTLDNNEAVNTFEQLYLGVGQPGGRKKGASGFRGIRVEQLMEQMGIGKDDPNRVLLRNVIESSKLGANAAAMTSGDQKQVQPAVQVKSKDEYNKLPSGTKFIAPDGSERIKP